ncbi:orexin receptor type 2-like [Neocloeon triangulifer]|uniref:orexin receptor type 2-like n=1 Tax=Neocloeon triangulifer TaxID=2078957 RepID=UPI00286EECD7|nr:orexin receptor type 2-like [Neocloeon triangulifer]
MSAMIVDYDNITYDENSTSNCTNEYCMSDDDYIALMEIYIFPTPAEWLLIAFHGLIFIAGLIGNALVCAAVVRNPQMRTVTNYFIVNLAVADFMVLVFCLPPSVVWDVTETWFLGETLCKGVLYTQTVSVAVSVLTLTFISVDRWYAICFPLKFKSTTGRAKTAILLIWLVALTVDIPELLALQTQPPKLRVSSHLFTQCAPNWSTETEIVYLCVKVVLLYSLPLVLMTVAYWQIVRVLWRSDAIPGHSELASSSATLASERTSSMRWNSSGSTRRTPLVCTANRGAETQLAARRKAAKMLVAVVVMFAVCYLPVHLLSILRYTTGVPQNHVTAAISMISHWLCYANSAVNPLIYNFMSGNFRKEFRRTFGCLSRRPRTHRFNMSRSGAPNSQHYLAGPIASSVRMPRSTEVVPLSAVTFQD